MPRYSHSEANDAFAKAGAQTLNRGGEVALQLDARNRAVVRDERADSREERMAASQALRDEVVQWEFEKEKRLDENAARMKIETNKQAISANEELFGINTSDDDADVKLADWGAKYFRVLDEKTGDPRLIKQFQINQQRVEKRQLLKARSEELNAARSERLEAAKAVRDETRAAKLEDAVASTEKARLGVTRPGKGSTPEQISDYKDRAALADKAILDARARLGGGAPAAAAAPATAPALPTLKDKAEFDALPSGTEYLRDGRRFRKP